MASPSKHDPPAPSKAADSFSPASDDLTDHEIAVKLNFTSECNKNDQRLSRSARRIRKFAGDWPWVWLEDILPGIVASRSSRDSVPSWNTKTFDEVKTFLQNTVMERGPNHRVLRLNDIKLARRSFNLGSIIQGRDNNAVADNDEEQDDEDDDEFPPDKGDATPGMGKSTKRLLYGTKRCPINKPVVSNNDVDSEFELEDNEDYATLLSTTRPSTRNSQCVSAKALPAPPPFPKAIGGKMTSTASLETSAVTSTSSSIEQVLQIIRAAASASDKNVTDNATATSTAREAIATFQHVLTDLDALAPADATGPLNKTLEDAKSAHKTIEDGKAAFEDNLIAMNMDEAVTQVIRKNYHDKLATTQSKIDDIEKQTNAAQAKVGNARAKLKSEIEQRELEAGKMERKGDKYKVDKEFWTTIENMVSLGHRRGKDISLDQIISKVKEIKVEEDDISSESTNETLASP